MSEFPTVRDAARDLAASIGEGGAQAVDEIATVLVHCGGIEEQDGQVFVTRRGRSIVRIARLNAINSRKGVATVVS